VRLLVAAIDDVDVGHWLDLQEGDRSAPGAVILHRTRALRIGETTRVGERVSTD
jgi:hypothetical protein